MAKRDITLEIGAKNKTQAGLAGATQSVRTFSRAVRTQLATALGPIALVTAALMALKKAFEFLADAADKGAKAMREMASQRAQSEINSINEAVKKLTSQYQRLNEQASAATEVMSAQKKAARELEKATLDLAKARDLEFAATLGDDAVAAVNKEYDIKQKILQAEQAIADAQDKKTQLEQEAQRAQEQSSKLLKQEQRFRETALRRQSDALELEKQANKMADSFLGRVNPDRVKALDEAVAKAREEADRVFQRAADVADARMKLELDAQKKIDLAREAGVEKEATEQAKVALMAKQVADDKIDLQKKISKVEENAANAKRQMMDEEDRQAEGMARKRLREIDEQIAAQGKLAGKTIQGIMDEIKANKEAEKVRAKEEKKMERLMRGRATKRGGKAQEFIDAFNARAAAEGGIQGLQHEKKFIEEQSELKELEKQNEKLEGLRKDLREYKTELLKLGLQG